MNKRLTALLLAAVMILCCGAAFASEGPDDTTNPEHFTVYYNYSSWNNVWGADEYSAFLSEKFNVTMDWSPVKTIPTRS